MCSREGLGISFQNDCVELRCPIWKIALSGPVIFKVNNATRFIAVRLVLFFFLLLCCKGKCIYKFCVQADKEPKILDNHVLCRWEGSIAVDFKKRALSLSREGI